MIHNNTLSLKEISWARIIATILIVGGHSFSFYTGGWAISSACPIPVYGWFSTFFTAIGLAVFTYISGYLYAWLYFYQGKYTDRRAFVAQKIRRILVPFFIWAVLQALLLPQYYPLSGIVDGAGHLWFLPMLFLVFIVADLLRPLWSKASIGGWLTIIASAVVLFMLTRYLRSLHIFLPTSLKQLFYYLPTFLFGMMTARMGQHLDRYLPVAASIAGLVLSAAMTLTCVVFEIKIGLNMVFCMIFSMLLVGLFRQTNLTLNSAARSINKCSMGIYILHHILIWYFIRFDSVHELLDDLGYAGPMLIFVTVFSLSWLLTSLCFRLKIAKYLFG